MTAPDIRPRRAIWGLVNDGYALVARSPNLSTDDAFELCRVPDIGDPSAYLDAGVAYLRTPKWGNVLARYFTNAERDSAGRASLVYDVVAMSDSDYAALGNDPFVAMPPLAADRRPERFGELAIPSPTPRDDTAAASRLAELLRTEDESTIIMLLGGILAGERVLFVSSGVRAETIECVTLLLPSWLRPALTFQAPTVDFPKHTPRLTVAERAHALLVEREWTAVLPRDAGDPRLAAAMATADRVVALGRTGDRLQRAWAFGAPSAPGSREPGAAVAAMLRMDLLHEGLRSGDLRRAVLVTARAETDDERLGLADALLAQAAPERVASALADVARGEQRGAWAAVQAIATAVAARRDQQPDRFAQFFTSLIDGLRVVPRPVDDLSAQTVRVTLACAAAALDDLDRFLEVADPALPWQAAWTNGTARWVKGRSPVARLFDALAAESASYADTNDAVNAIAATAVGGTGRVRAPIIALALVRRTLRERAALEAPDKLGSLADGLIRIWSSAGSAGSTDDVERALRKWCGVGEPLMPSDSRRLAAELSRTIADGQAGGEIELLGWMVAVLDRAHAGVVSEPAIRVVAALLEEHRRLGPHGEVTTTIGRVLLYFAATDAAFVFRPVWADVVRQVDDASRRELLTRALAWVARGYANGRFTIGALVDACVASGAEGGTIDDATAALLVPPLAAAAGSRGTASELALLAATVASLATPAAAEVLTDALLGSVGGDVADVVRMRRLALALQEIERVRDEDRYAEARSALRRVLAHHVLSADEERALRVFLGVEDGSMLGRILGRLPSLTPAGVAAGDRR
jgi:hypothetical protein